MTRQERIQQNQVLRNRYERQFRPVVKAALAGQYASYVKSLRDNGAQYVIDHPVANLVDPALTSALQQMYIHAGIGRASLTYRELQRLPRVQKKATGNIGFNAQWTDDILGYFRNNLFNKVVLPISETTQEYISNVLKQGTAEGWSIDRMVQEIERKDYLDGRVERILRTEINRAINYGNELAAKTYSYKTQKRWISVHDNRTRHPHALADAQVVNIDEPFIVGGERLFFPGDPNGSATNTINCRCVTEIVAIRDNTGRLTPKDTAQPRVSGRLRGAVQDAIAELLS